MSPTRRLFLRILAGLMVFLLGCPPPDAPPSRQVILQGITTVGSTGLAILGEMFFLNPNSTGSFLLVVRDPDTQRPVNNGRVVVELSDPNGGSVQVFTGRTDDQGIVEVSFTVPAEVANPDQVLVVRATSSRGTATYEEPVYVGRAYSVLVTSDKPVYQPGQTIHLRALALDTVGLHAADNQPIVFTVTDPGGNKLMRQEVQSSQYGIAATDFVLDSLATSGDYILTAEIGPVSSSRSVEVKPYNLPRFKVTFTPDKPFYLAGETATGTVQADYFFGKPVAGGKVTLRAFVTDVERVEVTGMTGTTDDDGAYTFAFPIPDYFVGQLENNAAEIDVEITVVDTADHAETIDETLTIAEKTLLLEAVPESGGLRPGLENIIYVNSSYPDGRAAPAAIDVVVEDLPDPIELTTDDFGLARFSFTPTLGVAPVITLTAVSTAGEAATQVLTLSALNSATALLLRPERAEVRIGDTLNLDIHVAGTAQTAYLDIVKGRQTFALAALPITDGVAQAAIDIDGSFLGTLELNAYVVTDGGEIVRDRRLVLVNPAPAQVDITTDAEVYRPGETANVSIQVTRDGAPMPGALGISIVDESVFSVGAQDPGFARTYFLIERELLEPRYEIRGFVDLADDDPSPYDDNPDSIRIAGQAANPGVTLAPARDLALQGLFAQTLAAETQAAVPAATPDALPWWLAWANRLILIAPLAGFALYDGSRVSRRRLIAAIIFGVVAAIVSACAAGPGAAPAAPASAPMSETTATRGGTAAPRLRQYFPETLYWMPEMATDDAGRAHFELPLADSITSWRISVLASDTDGNLGSAQANLRVFQEFFVEPDLPRFLTVGDEIDIPVSVYNYLETAQNVNLRVQTAPWFELLGPADQTLELGPNEVTAAYIPIRVLDFGSFDFTVTATGDQASDAIRRTVEVLPNGQAQSRVLNGQLDASQSFTVSVPNAAIPGTGRVTVKLYPGLVAQTVDGLAGLLRAPYGCFEQTSSINYPNILVLDYLRNAGRPNPEVEMTADAYLNAGYQRLLTFEVRSMPGGFSLFGDPPPDTMLTAYGLMQFADMSRVRYVDPALLARTAQFLMDRQGGNGSWSPRGLSVSSSDLDKTAGDPAATAYMIWALSDAGFADSDAVRRGLDFLDTAFNPAEADSYVLTLVANAVVAADGPAQPLLDELARRALPERNNSARWTSGATTWLRAYGETVTLETTAMTAIAFLRSGTHLDLAEQALRYITERRDQFGAYGSTQSTVMALKALALAAGQSGGSGEAVITITLGDGRSETITIDDATADVMRQVTFDDIGPEGQVLEISMTGERTVQYQLATGYYVAWPSGEASGPAPTPQGVRIQVAYDRTELTVNDLVQVTASVELLRPGIATTLLVDVGIPPGFSPQTGDLDQLVAQGAIARYELTGRQIIFYLEDFPSGEVRQLTYRLLARYPIRAQTPAHRAYDYYTPTQQATQPPQRIVVTLGTPR